LSDVQRSQPHRRDSRYGGSSRGFRRERPAGGGPTVDYRALVEYVAKSLAEKPDEVLVESFERGAGTLAIKVKLADEDVGRFIGKSGRNIEAIRTLVRVASLRDHQRVFVDLANPSGSAHGSPRLRGSGEGAPE